MFNALNISKYMIFLTTQIRRQTICWIIKYVTIVVDATAKRFYIILLIGEQFADDLGHLTKNLKKKPNK